MTKEERRIKQSLTFIGLSILSHFVNVNYHNTAEEMKKGYLSSWSIVMIEDDSKRMVKYHMDIIKDAFGENWTEKLHDKVKELIDNF